MVDLPPGSKTLAAVGGALGAWSLVELQLGTIFGLISDMPSDHKARALFDGIISFEIRLSILDRLYALDGADALEAEMWNRMSARLSKFYKKRHELAHFTIISDNGTCQISPFMTWQQFHLNQHRVLREEQIKERADKFMELVAALEWFKGALQLRRWREELADLPQQPEPPFVSRLRETAAQILEDRKRQPQPSQG